MTATNVAFNTRIAAGGSQSFGFQGTHSGGFTEPERFTLNGAACTVA